MRTTRNAPERDPLCRGEAIRRRGFTLVEMIVVISLTGLLGVLATRLLIEMQRVRDAQRKAVAADLARGQLARAFRADVRAAIAAHSEDPATLRLDRRDGGRVIYAADEARVTRTVKQDERVVRRDAFSIGDASRFAVADDGQWATWTRSRLAINRSAGESRPFVVVVEAAADRHRRRASSIVDETSTQSEDDP